MNQKVYPDLVLRNVPKLSGERAPDITLIYLNPLIGFIIINEQYLLRFAN